MARSKRTKRSSARKGKPKMRIPRILSDGFPTPKAYATFVYSGTGSCALSTNPYGSGIINCNAIYDPEASFTTYISGERNAQPRYRDQIMGVLYDQYRVTGSKCEIQLVNTGADETNLCRAFIYRVPHGSADIVPSNPGLVDEHPYVNGKGGMVRDLGVIRGSRSHAKLTSSWNQYELDREQFVLNQATTGNNPTILPQYKFGLVTHDGTVGNSPVNINYKLTYHVLLSGPYYQVAS